jgi:hypothetical protein
LTRSQAAFSISYFAGISNEDSAKAVCDGFEDDGIDAIYYAEETGIVYLVQSKWDSGGNKSPDLGSVEKFIKGAKDFLAGKFERFNDKVKKQQEKFEKALDSSDVEFVLVLAYTGIQPLSIHAEQAIGDFLKENNEPTDIISYKILSQKELYKALSSRLEGTSIKLDNVTLYEWGQVREPFQAIYGQVDAEEIARWYQDYDTRLLTRNLRKFKGDTDVNLSIKRTLVSDPGKFWYFNNGITVLCEKFRRTGRNDGVVREIAQFTFEGVSVVNGAQTVGVISSTISQGFPKAKQARILVRFISLENCPPEFGNDVTTATNTQNKIEVRDFVSLDTTHERIRQELSLDLNKTYAYKSGEKEPLPQEGCSIEEATIALACAYPDTQLAADVKSNISRIWEYTNKPPYTLLFNDNLSAIRLWKTIEIARYIQTELAKQQQISKDTERRRVAIHGNRFVMHRVFQSLPLDRFDDPNFDTKTVFSDIEKSIPKELDEIVKAVGQHYPDIYLNTLFKSGTKCVGLAKNLHPVTVTTRAAYYQTNKAKQPSLFGENKS